MKVQAGGRIRTNEDAMDRDEAFDAMTGTLGPHVPSRAPARGRFAGCAARAAELGFREVRRLQAAFQRPGGQPLVPDPARSGRGTAPNHDDGIRVGERLSDFSGPIALDLPLVSPDVEATLLKATVNRPGDRPIAGSVADEQTGHRVSSLAQPFSVVWSTRA